MPDAARGGRSSQDEPVRTDRRGRSLGNHHRHLRILDAAVDLVRVRHPLDQLLGTRSEGQKMGKNLLRRLGEKLTLLVRRGLIQRSGNGFRFGAPTQLLGWPPIGATGVQRVQDRVLFRVVETLNKLTRWVVHDGRIAAFSDLHEELHNKPGFERSHERLSTGEVHRSLGVGYGRNGKSNEGGSERARGSHQVGFAGLSGKVAKQPLRAVCDSIRVAGLKHFAPPPTASIRRLWRKT